MKSTFRTFPVDTGAEKMRNQVLLALSMMMLFGLLVPSPAFAADISLPVITDVACPILRWMQGPLGIVVFLLVVGGTLLVGMVAKMDWSRIISVTILLALLVGMTNVAANVEGVRGALDLNSCLRV